jgi:hypothetical protein
LAAVVLIIHQLPIALDVPFLTVVRNVLNLAKWANSCDLGVNIQTLHADDLCCYFDLSGD